MEKKEAIYEGKAKILYSTDNPDQLVCYYKDDATAGNGAKKGTIILKIPAKQKNFEIVLQIETISPLNKFTIDIFNIFLKNPFFPLDKLQFFCIYIDFFSKIVYNDSN